MKHLNQFVIALGCVVMFLNSAEAQQKVSVNGISFNSKLEVAEAQLSKEKVALVLSEIDKTDPKYQTDNCTNCKDGKSLILEVDFKRGFKFPIEETDSVYVRFSLLQESLLEHQFVSGELSELERSRNKAEEAKLKSNAEIIKEKSKVISKQLEEGKISPQEAQKRLMALMEPQMNDVMNSQLMKNIENIDEYDDSRAVYSMHFYNNERLTDTETYSGYLYIKVFNETKFVAEYRGELIEQCVEKRAASSIEEEQKCKSKPSKYLPGAGVLNEGSGSIFIDVDIKAFLNNR